MIFARLVLAAVIVSAALYAVRTPSPIRSALALALGNTSLAILFFLLTASYAASVQLSVGAGVVGALFILAISLTESMRGTPNED